MINKEVMMDAVNGIDEELIEKYLKTEAMLEAKKARRRRMLWVKWGAAAASAALITSAALAVTIPLLNREKEPTGEKIPGKETEASRYKDMSIITPELGIVWPWEYQTVYEQYSDIEVNGMKYLGTRREISSELIEKKLGSYQATGYDNFAEAPDHIHYKTFDAYEISNVLPSRRIAVEMEGKYYVFSAEDHQAPAQLGTVLEQCKFAQVMELELFWKKEPEKEHRYFSLKDDAYVWEILNSCRSAPVADAMGWNQNEKNCIGFTLTSESLGVYKHAMYITEDGYLWTNVFDVAYLYNIGTDAAGKIISYAMGNCENAEYEPYELNIIGNVTEIADGYMLVDDSVRCIDPEDGIVYKVLLKDMRMQRYVENQIIKVGSSVMIRYEKEINAENGYVIDSAVSASKVIITEKGVMIPE